MSTTAKTLDTTWHTLPSGAVVIAQTLGPVPVSLRVWIPDGEVVGPETVLEIEALHFDCDRTIAEGRNADGEYFEIWGRAA